MSLLMGEADSQANITPIEYLRFGFSRRDAAAEAEAETGGTSADV
jgi:hypothetical protein